MANGPFCGNGGCYVEVYRCTDGTHALVCAPGGNNCLSAYFVKGVWTDVHDQVLQQATDQLNGVLNDIQPDAQGRRLAFIRVNVGVRLAWVYNNAPPAGSVKITDEAELNGVLGIQG